MQKFFLISILCLIHLDVSAYTINVSSGHHEPLPIAVNHFAADDEFSIKLAKKIHQVIAKDLDGAGVFKLVSQAAFIENRTGVHHTPLFAAWQQIYVNLLLNAEVTSLGNKKISVKFVLWDTILEKQVVSEHFELSLSIWRRAAHRISDKIYQAITGYEGYFDTRIVYVAESGPYLKRTKRLAIMDQDGANHQYITDGTDLVLTPRFSPDNNNILYLSYKNRTPQIHMLNLATGRTRLLGKFPGMSFAPRFSPDGQYAVMSIAKEGSTHIYEMNLATRRMTQLTRGFSINTSPSYSPDGSIIIFNSNAHGKRSLFVMDRNGKNKKKISLGVGIYAEPAWSNKDYIAFTKISRDYGFTIGILSAHAALAQKNSERLITSGYLVESPAWSHNGRLLIFSKGVKPRKNMRQKLNQLYIIDLIGNNERLIPTPQDASDPDWSKPIDH